MVDTMPRPRKQTDLDAAIAQVVSRAAHEIAAVVRENIARNLASVLGGESQPRRGPGRLPGPVAKQVPAKKERNLTPEGRKRLSELMKARWAKRRAAKSK
jgi:hypothetical protein